MIDNKKNRKITSLEEDNIKSTTWTKNKLLYESILIDRVIKDAIKKYKKNPNPENERAVNAWIIVTARIMELKKYKNENNY